MTARCSRLAVDALAVTAICGILGTTDDVVMRSLASIPLVFFLPGYALLRALKWEATLPLQRQTIEVGLSIAVTIVSGFILNSLGRLDPIGWAVWLSTVVLVSSSIATFRGAAVVALGITLRRPGSRTVLTAIAFTLALGTFAATFLWKINEDNNYRPFRFTEFWMVPLHPTVASAFTIGVANQEMETHDFDIEVRVDGATLAVWRALTVKPGESLTKIITVPEGGPHARQVTAWLFKSDDPSFIYRQTSAFLPPQTDLAPR